MNKSVKNILKWTCAVLFAVTAATSVSMLFGVAELSDKGLYSSDYEYVSDAVHNKVNYYMASRVLNAVVHPGSDNTAELFSEVNKQGLEFSVHGVLKEDSETYDYEDQNAQVLYRTRAYREGNVTGYVYASADENCVFFSDTNPSVADINVTRIINNSIYWFKVSDYGNYPYGEVPKSEGEENVSSYNISYHENGSYPDNGLYARADLLASEITSFCSGAAPTVVFLACVSLIFLVAAIILTGKDETIFHKIPYIFVLAAAFLGVVFCTFVAREVADSFFNDDMFLSIRILIIPAFAAAMIGAGLLLQTVERIKSGTFYKNTFTRRVVDIFSQFTSNVPLFLKAGIGFVVVTLIQIIGLSIALDGKEDIAAAGLLIYKVVEIILLVLFVVHAARISSGITKVSKGVFDNPVNTSGMTGLFKKAATELNGISDSLNIAVEERMKSERMKAELITNVSHDIKTPLTSIINYVDLLKGEDVENEKAAGYIEIIDKHSQRLKKLTIDLVEASKASTGNVEIHPEDIDAKVFLSQINGEFEERLEKSGLTAIVNCPQEDVYVRADGRWLWRIIENLMVNICKYAMPGTRVYLDLTHRDGKVFFSFKNISGAPLNISANELKERFVRGDRSRNTEGSGLGLSIAEDLATLMGGKLDLSIDGDLFKVTASLPEGSKPEAALPEPASTPLIG